MLLTDSSGAGDISKNAFLVLPFIVLCHCLSEVTRDSWLCPFSKLLWLSLMGTSWIVAIVIWCLDRKSPQGYYHMLKDSGEDGFTLLGRLGSFAKYSL